MYGRFKLALVWLQYLRCPCRWSRPGRRGSGCGTAGSGRSAHRRRASCGSLETTPPSALDPSARRGRRTSCGALSTRCINFIDTNRNKKKGFKDTLNLCFCSKTRTFTLQTCLQTYMNHQITAEPGYIRHSVT